MNALTTTITAGAVAAAAAFGGYAVGHGSRASTARPAPSASPAPTPSASSPSASPSPTESPFPTATGCFASADTQRQMNACAGADLDDADRRLAAVLADARRLSTGAARTALEKAQREWRAYRDTHCGAYLIEGGSIGGMNGALCQAGLALERARAICDLLSPNGPDAPPSCAAVARP